jgi:hypothetical protein
MTKTKSQKIILACLLLVSACGARIGVETQLEVLPQLSAKRYSKLNSIMTDAQTDIEVFSMNMMFGDLDDSEFEESYSQTLMEIMEKQIEKIQTQISEDIRNLNLNECITYLGELFNKVSISSRVTGNINLILRNFKIRLISIIEQIFASVSNLEEITHDEPLYQLYSIKSFGRKLQSVNSEIEMTEEILSDNL